MPSEISMDEEFLKKVKSAILNNLANESFGADDLAEEVSLSRSQLYRKLSSLTGESISDSIRNMRLKHALDLLKKNTGTISEISYQVGFNSPSYFTKCFQEYFGYTPGEVSKNIDFVDQYKTDGQATVAETLIHTKLKNKIILIASILMLLY